MRNQASYGTSIGSDYKSCLGSNSFSQCRRITHEMCFISSDDFAVAGTSSVRGEQPNAAA